MFLEQFGGAHGELAAASQAPNGEPATVPCGFSQPGRTWGKKSDSLKDRQFAYPEKLGYICSSLLWQS